MSLPHHPAAQILTRQVTDSNDPLISIKAAFSTTDRPAANLVRQSERRDLTAPISLAVFPFTELTAFRGIDAMQSDALAMDFDCITIDDGSSSGDD
jgi:hypothetical protein